MTATDFSGNEGNPSTPLRNVGVPDPQAAVRSTLLLAQNWPNPFGAGTTVRYNLPDKMRVTLTIYDASGRLVAKLVDQTQETGEHSVYWSGRNSQGRAVAPGTYFVRLTADGSVLVSKMSLIR
ncbi:MAG: FlgD immunoglobulin-like domain containing protein [Candidatus Eisenbacteria bacterium]|nr:FlgD immunoglobulin-like domain containing protein [Candidatus Eisenbacteria bacterium]